MQVSHNDISYIDIFQFALIPIILLLNLLTLFLQHVIEHEIEMIELVDFVLGGELVDFED